MNKYLYVNVFVAGLATIATEFSASRSLQNIYGASNFVWATIIGLIMIYFALGYHFGGKFAERADSLKGMFQFQIIASVLLSLLPLVSNTMLVIGAEAFDQLEFPALAGAFISVILLYSIPVILLAMTTPVVVRFFYGQGYKVGEISGNISAVSTVGSVLGAFIPTLWLFGILGTGKTLQLIAVAMLLTAMVGLFIQNKNKLILLGFFGVVIIEIALLGLKLPIKKTSGQIYETESAYNYIEVLQIEKDTLLRLNEGQGFHSQYNPDTHFYSGPWELFLLGPLFSDDPSRDSIQNILVVGMAAGTTLSQAAVIYPDANLTGIELDPEIIRVGIEYFDFDSSRSNIIVGDGRYELRKIETQHNLIIVDAYVPPYIPPHMVTKEFFALCKSKLVDGGVVAINVGRMPDDRTLINDLATTMRTSFEYLIIADLPDTFNTIIFGSDQPLLVDNLTRNYVNLDPNKPGDRLLIQTAQNSFDGLREDFQPGIVYTDDHNSIEQVTNRMIFDFLLSQ